MGIYTEIVEIIAPSEAAYGDLVTVEVRVRKLYEDWLPIMVGGWLDNTEIWFSPEYKWFEPGDIQPFPFTYSFTMPNKAVHIYVWSYYGPNGDWIEDDYGYAYIALAGVPEPYIGTISKKELEYDEARADIPAYDIPQGERGLVHIWARNNMSTRQKLGIYWVIRKPNGFPEGEIVEEYYDWQMFSTGPGDEHEFIGGRFDLDEGGLYDIRCGLLMNPDSPVYVDVYYGDLCTVAAAVPEPYAGTITKKELEYDEARANIPAYNIPQGERGLVHIWGRNDMSTNQKMGIYWIVRGPPGYPNGPILEEYFDWETFWTGPGKEQEFIGDRFNLDKAGLYDIRCGLLMNPDDPHYVDTYYGDLSTVAAVVPEPQFRGFGVTEYVTV